MHLLQSKHPALNGSRQKLLLLSIMEIVASFFRMEVLKKGTIRGLFARSVLSLNRSEWSPRFIKRNRHSMVAVGVDNVRRRTHILNSPAASATIDSCTRKMYTAYSIW